MTPEPNDQEFEAVLSLPPDERYEHFLKRTVDFDEVWMAEDEEGLITVNGPDGREALLVWPARRYAENALKREWPEASYLAVAVEDWLELTLRPLKDSDDVVVAVFCDSEGVGFCPDLPDVIADVEAELGIRLDAQPGFDPDAEEIDLNALLKPAMKASMKAKPRGKLP